MERAKLIGNRIIMVHNDEIFVMIKNDVVYKLYFSLIFRSGSNMHLLAY